MAKKNNMEILVPHENRWVALSLDESEVLAAGKQIETVDRKLRKLKIKRGDAILMFVPKFDAVWSM